MEEMGWFSFLRERYSTASCRGTLAMLERTLPGGQKARCRGNNLEVDWVYPAGGEGRALSAGVLCPLLYRELANSLKFLSDARTAPRDILERVEFVRLKLVHPQLTIHGITRGKDMVEMAAMDSPRPLAGAHSGHGEGMGAPCHLRVVYAMPWVAVSRRFLLLVSLQPRGHAPDAHGTGEIVPLAIIALHFL